MARRSRAGGGFGDHPLRLLVGVGRSRDSVLLLVGPGSLVLGRVAAGHVIAALGGTCVVAAQLLRSR